MVPGTGDLKKLGENWFCMKCKRFLNPFYVLVDGAEMLACEYCFLDGLPEDAKLGEAAPNRLLLSGG